MHFDGLCRQLGTVDPRPLADAVAAFDDEAWSAFGQRQQTFEVHSATQTIPLLYDEDMRHENPTAWPRLSEFEPLLRPALDLIQSSYPRGPNGEGYFIRILFTRLSPGSTIGRHRDRGESLMRSHRHHVPLATSPLVDFFVGGTQNHFAAGEVWEINNRAYHAVRNLSANPRIHLIADYVVPGERVDDPEGTIFA